MMNKGIATMIVAALFLLASITPVLAGTQIKTVGFSLGADHPGADTVRLTNAVINVANSIRIYLPESGINVRHAWIESYVSAATATDLTAVQVVFNGVTYNPVTALYGDQSGELYSAWVITNVTDAFASFANPLLATMTIKHTGPSTSAHTSRLFVTYEYDDTSTEQLNTVIFPIDSFNNGLAGTLLTTINATIAEHNDSNSVQSAWFDIGAFQDGLLNGDGNLKARINADPYTPYAFYETGLTSYYDVMYLFNVSTPGNTSFLLNTQKTLDVTEADAAVFRGPGGELFVTYNYTTDAPKRTRTISYFMGQGTTRGQTTRADYYRQITLPGKNVNVKYVWAKVYGGFASTAVGTLTINGSINGNAAPSRAYTYDTILVGGYEPIIYNMTSVASSLTDGITVGISAQYSQAINTPAGIQLFITYQYDKDSSTEIKTVRHLAGQTTGLATSNNFSTNVYVLEASPTLQSKYLDTTRTDTTAVDPTETSTINGSSSVAVQMDSAEIQFHKMVNNDSSNILTATNNSYDIILSSATNTGGNAVIFLTYSYTPGPTVSLNETTISARDMIRAENVTREVRVNASTGTLTNVNVTQISGNGTGITTANHSIMGSLGTSGKDVSFYCTPAADQALGIYETNYRINASEDRLGLVLLVKCPVVTPSVTLNETAITAQEVSGGGNVTREVKVSASISTMADTNITETGGNGSGFITTNSTLMGTVGTSGKDASFYCAPPSKYPSGIYEATYRINSSSDPTGEDLTVQCRVKPSATAMKTVAFALGQDLPNAATVRTTNTVLTVATNVPIYIPERNITVRSAWIESYASAATATDLTAVEVVFNGVTYNPVTALYGDQSGEAYSAWVITNVTGANWDFVTPMRANMTIKYTGPSTSAHSSRLFITYEYDSNSPEQVNTVIFPIDSMENGLSANPSYFNITYNATIAEHNDSNSVQSAWFDIGAFQDGIQSADGNLKAHVQNDADTPTAFYETGLLSYYEARFLFNVSTPGSTSFLLNTEQKLNVTKTATAVMRGIGGELFVTYNFTSDAQMRTRTVSYFMGQGETRGQTARADFYRQIKIPETNVDIKYIWARVRGGFASTTAGTLTINGSVDGVDIPSRAYAIDTILVGGYQPLIYNMTSLASSLIAGSTVGISYTYSQAINTPAGIDLFITYQYNNTSTEQLKTVRHFAGQSTGQGTKINFSTNVYVPEQSTTLQGGYLDNIRSSTTAIDPVLSSGINETSDTSVQVDSGEIQFQKLLNNDSKNVLTATNNSYNVILNSTTNTVGNAVIVLTYNYSIPVDTCVLSLNTTTANFSIDGGGNLSPNRVSNNTTMSINNTGTIAATITIKGTEFEGPAVLGVNNTTFAGGDSFTFAALTLNEQTHKTNLGGGGAGFDSYTRVNIPQAQKAGRYNQNITYTMSC